MIACHELGHGARVIATHEKGAVDYLIVDEQKQPVPSPVLENFQPLKMEHAKANPLGSNGY